MSQDFTRPRTRQTHHILIIDDSARLRQTLGDLIVANCLATGKIFKVFHSDKDGKFTQSNEVPGPGMLLLDGINRMESSVIDEFTIYTAPSPKQALFVINSPVFSRLTIISDVMMPADTEVGLIGMLEAIARRKLPVNLVFASSDAQNSFVVAKLVETGKAYFLVKQGSAWEDLSRALVQRAEGFRFKTINSLDFEGMQKIAGIAMRTTSQSVPIAEPAKPVEPSAPAYNPPTTTTPSQGENQFKRPGIRPLHPPNHPPRAGGLPAANRPLPPQAPRTPGQPVRPEGIQVSNQPARPDLPPAPNPVLKPAQPPNLNQPIRATSTETPKIEGFLPVTPTTPPAKNAPPPMPVWDDPVTLKNREPEEKPAAIPARPAAPVQFSPVSPEVVNPALAEPTLVSPAQTKTPLSRFADIPGPKARPVFLLFRPFVALINAWKKR